VRREFSAGVVLVRRMRGRWWLAAVRPQGKRAGTWALPKGLVDTDEKPAETAVREGFEETGVRSRLEGKLGDVRYVYTWEGERVFKVVSFFLFRYRSGSVENHDHEVESAAWMPLEEAAEKLSYKGEREMAAAALSALRGER
jgi:8-oxo-dGTP pyrophosphatase MutT (NUDIX family)